ncbi:MAG: hypothetical protein RL112_323 [Planctomycetota bacterium]|jgi:hypothetical protein
MILPLLFALAHAQLPAGEPSATTDARAPVPLEADARFEQAGALAPSAAPRGDAAFPARQVAAPASDIEAGVVRLPDPASAAGISRGLLRRLDFAGVGPTRRATARIEIGASGAANLGLLGPSAARWRVLLARASDAGSAQVDARLVEDHWPVVPSLEPAGDALPGWMVAIRKVRGLERGEWRVVVECDARDADPEAWLGVELDGPQRVAAWCASWRRVAGEPLAIVARATPGRATAGRMRVEHGGLVEEADLLDDGLHDDGAADDGTFGAWLPPGATGRVQVLVELSGGAPDERWTRSAPLALELHAPLLELSGSLDARPTPAGTLALDIEARLLAPSRRVLVAAEVWGRDQHGAARAACWLARMVEPRRRVDAPHGAWDRRQLRLELDLEWLECTGLRGPLELRAVRVQDKDTSGVLATAERIPIHARVPERGPRPPRPPAPRLLHGGALAATSAASATRVAAAGAVQPALLRPSLMLVHGYCSSGQPWPATDFAQPKLAFLDANANRSHDEFALLMAQRAQAAGLTSFGVVGHSQGGAAALHLRTYYASPLDLATGPRRIQAVATPWLGTPLSSLSAFSCGSNANLTTNGATSWLAGIPSWARAEASSWTTSNAGGACNFFASLLLSDPEDGTVERARGVLPGGNDMGHVLGWCHTTGMSEPANYQDAARNAEMDAQAAR